MSNFCTKCGKKLEKDEKCSCEKIKEEKKVKNNSFSDMDIISIMSNFLTRPIDTFNIRISKTTNYLLILFATISYSLFSSIVMGIFFPYEFIKTFLIFLMFAAIISIIANMMLKKVNTFNETLDIVSKSSIIILVGSLISLIFAFISYKISLILMICSGILFLFDVYHGIYLKISNDKNKLGYLLIIALVLTLLVDCFLKSII